MTIALTDIECRIIGCLMEKAVYTPDQYPLTLNSLVLACNQKSSREPVMALESGTVKNTLRQLEGKHLVVCDENFRGRAERFSQRFCNTAFSELQLTPQEYAVVCVLLLRGAQTPGEIRARSGRLFEFLDNGAVTDTLQALIDRPGSPLAARLPRMPGRQDHSYVHCFSGAVVSVASEDVVDASESSGVRRVDRIAELEQRVDALELALASLIVQLGG